MSGNGRAVLPPLVVEPMRRYRQPQRPRRSRARLIVQVLGWILLGVLVVVSGLAGGLYLYAHQTLSAIAPHSKAVRDAVPLLARVPPPSQPATALLIGYQAGEQTTDTLMLVRADPQAHTLSMLSFPRDLVVPIYCKDASVVVRRDRINSAWACGGPTATLNTVEKLTGVAVNYLITVNFHGFKLLVNRLNGVYIDVDHRYLNSHGGPAGYATIDLEPGYQLLSGGQALDFVRFRHTDSDLYRNARQQLFIGALKQRLASSVSIFEIPKLVGAVKGNLEIGSGGCATCAPSLSEIESYAGLAYKLPPGHLFRHSFQNLQPYGPYGYELVASPSSIQAAVDTFEHPDVTLAARANAVALGRKAKAPKPPRLRPSQITTLVLNGTTIPGLAHATSSKLALAGYHTVQLPPQLLANAPSQGFAQTSVFWDPAQPQAQQAARELKTAFGAHAVIAPLPAELTGFAQQAGNPLTVIVVGASFDGQLVNPQAQTQPTPLHRPPAVRTDPGLTLATLRDAQRKLRFRVMVPHLVEQSSRLALLEPVRVYAPAPHHEALVLTFVTGGGNAYWQLLETNWTEAPILRHPTDQPRLGGRSFDLHTAGANIHMIVLHQGNATYWLVNTLRDELSNETMIAIAKALQPLPK